MYTTAKKVIHLLMHGSTTLIPTSVSMYLVVAETFIERDLREIRRKKKKKKQELH